MHRNAAIKIVWVLAGVLLVSGCVSRSEIKRMMDQLDYLESSNQKLERQAALSDSLLRVQEQEMERLKAGFNATNRDLLARLDNLDGKVSDMGEWLSQITKRVERPMPKPVIPPIPPVDTTSPGAADTTKPSGTTVDPNQLYDTAFRDFRKQNYDLAVSGFTEFLEMFPTSAKAADAQYWLAESCNKKGNYAKAIEEFTKVTFTYPQSDKAPTALFKIGLAWEAQNQPAEAQKAYQQLVSQYPNSEAARFARDKLPAPKKSR